MCRPCRWWCKTESAWANTLLLPLLIYRRSSIASAVMSFVSQHSYVQVFFSLIHSGQSREKAGRFPLQFLQCSGASQEGSPWPSVPQWAQVIDLLQIMRWLPNYLHRKHLSGSSSPLQLTSGRTTPAATRTTRQSTRIITSPPTDSTLFWQDSTYTTPKPRRVKRRKSRTNIK